VTSLKLGHLSRYGELGRLLLAHRGALRGDAPDEPAKAAELQEDAEKLVRELQELGPTYVKLGQLLSSRVDLLPSAYTDALRRLQDHAEPLSFEVVRRVAEEELGTRLSAVFSRVDQEPLGSASMAQVHRAVMRDGRVVAVKVQRPGIRAQILDDMDVIGELAATLDEHVGAARRAGFAAMVEEFRRALLDELDFRREATNLKVLGDVIEPYPRLVAPVPLEDQSTSRLLVMTLIEGETVGSLAATVVPPTEGSIFVSQLFKAYLDQILVHGVYHADPHPGNVVLTFDRRLALLDVGMTGRLSPELREALLRMLVALGEGRGTAVAAALERAGEQLEDFDRNGLQRDVSALVVTVVGAQVQSLEVGRQVAELARVALRNGLRPAPELSMVGKALLNLDDVARRLAPTYEPAAAIREHTASLTRDQLLSAASPSRMISAALDAKEFTERLPDRMNRLLESIADGRIHIRVEGMDEREIMRSVQKLANRAAAGLAVAAFLLAAAIFSVSSAGPRWWGISVFTVVFLGIADVIGAAIVLSTVRNDLPQRRAARRRFRKR
jgi:ubiquinone biosynthesis protein